jgi:hypothetical protein
VDLRVEEDPPPVVRALARDLASRLSDRGFSEATAGLVGTVSLRDAATPQAATIRLRGDSIALVHGEGGTADIHATVSLGEPGEPELDGATEHPELAEWLRALLAPERVGWEEAAAGFWQALHEMAGAPGALRVVELESGAERRFGSPEGYAYELHGRSEELAAVMTGRVPVVDAAFTGRVFVRGSFAELSVLAGAGFRVRYGLGAEPDDEAGDA